MRYKNGTDVYGRTYSLDDVIRYRCRFATGFSSEARCESLFREQLRREGALFSRWVRVRIPVDSLQSYYECADGLDARVELTIAEYVCRRQGGGRFPPIIVIPAREYPIDGNHRVRAAQIVGDEWIDAFVPVMR